MALTYGSNVSANLTRFGSIKVSVLDTDPSWPQDMANDMAHLVDSIANRMRNDRARDAYNLALSTLDQTTDQIAEAEDSLATLHSLGIYDFEAQVEGLTAQYGMALASNNGAAARTIRKDLEQLGALANGYNNLSAYLESALRAEGLAPKAGGPDARRCRNAAASSFVVDYASAADKKAKPVRWLIVVMTAIVAVGAAFLGMLAWETLQRAQASNA